MAANNYDPSLGSYNYWGYDSFENVALTRALQMSLSDAATSPSPSSSADSLPRLPRPNPRSAHPARSNRRHRPGSRPDRPGQEAEAAPGEEVGDDLHHRRPGELPGDGPAGHRDRTGLFASRAGG
uniref:Uncharacterized protein n=1 Tax=Ananas comosus var. bracteatus TaxID=296719 RepID=A0A6V7PE09_ANACO|nr:unnamed protein product [Ananas comosus var. bracteatus]